ncbi:hypothetical protein ABIB50_003829 [Mucilaginibacter sp. UYCu711]
MVLQPSPKQTADIKTIFFELATNINQIVIGRGKLAQEGYWPHFF